MPAAFFSPRFSLTLVFIAFGALIGCWAGAIPTVARAASATNLELGMGLSLSTATSVVVMGFGARLSRRFSGRSLICAALVLSTIATAVLLLSGSPLAFLVNIAAFGACLGLLDVSMNAEAGAIEREMRRPVFTFFHGALSAAMPLFAVLSSFISVRYGLGYTALIACAAAAFGFAAVVNGLPSRAPASPARDSRSRATHGLALTLLGLAASASMIVESSAIFWSAKLLDEMAPSLAIYAGLGAAFFGACAAAIRLPGDLLRARFGELPVMLFSITVAIAGCIVLAQSTSFAPSVAAFAAIGFGTAILCPCIFAIAARTTPDNSASGIGRVSLVAGPPRIAAPWIFGWVADASGIASAFGLCAAVLALAFALLVVLRAQDRSQMRTT